MFKLDYPVNMNNMQHVISNNYKECLEILAEGLSLIEDPNIISIGSGSGYFEKCIGEMLNKKITCVDPKPFNYEGKGVFIEPGYKTILDIDPKELEKINFALIIWPSPDHYISDEDIKYDSQFPYDYDALFKILPDGFFTIYAPCGASGSKKFINCINKISQDNLFSSNAPEIDYSNVEFDIKNGEKSKTYKCVSSLKKISGDGYGFGGNTITYACFIDKNLVAPNDSTLTKHNVTRKSVGIEDGCLIS